MDKKEKINAVYDALRQAGRAATKKEFARLLGINYTYLTRAMNGDPGCLTDSLVAKATALLEGKPVPKPEPTPVDELAAAMRSQAETLLVQAEQARLASEVARKQEENIGRLIALLEKERAARLEKKAGSA